MVAGCKKLWTALQILWSTIYIVCGAFQLVAAAFFLISVSELKLFGVLFAGSWVRNNKKNHFLALFVFYIN